MDVVDSSEHELWGWRSFFEQITEFLNEAERHFGTANEAYALYVIERFEVCMSNVRQLKAHLSENDEISDNVGEVVISQSCYSAWNCY